MPKRTPSLHISENDLAEILADTFTEDSPFEFEAKDMDKLARTILLKAKTKSVAGRSIVATNQVMHKKAEKIRTSGRSEAGVFAQLLLLTRRKAHHRGIKLIEPFSKEWPQLKEVCKLATEFCNEFGISIKEGYKAYLEIAVKMMKNFTLNKFQSLHQAICTHYESTEEIKSDRNPEKTKELYIFYIKMINEKVGWDYNDYESNPEKYVCFVRASANAIKIGVSHKTYIKAQFAGLEFGEKQNIPDPLQLYGDKAIQRVRKYCFNNDISIQQAKGLDFKKIKNASKA